MTSEERTELFNLLTPMQQLVMENLASRYRLGHNIWTFTRNDAITKALRILERTGYVTVMHGVVERTVRASLTEYGRKLILDPEYTPPATEVDQCPICESATGHWHGCGYGLPSGFGKDKPGGSQHE